MIFQIYKVTNNINGKIYIGKTSRSLNQRWHEHTSRANIGVGVNRYFMSAIRKHGPENFTVKELDCTENEQQANWLESWYIGITGCYKREVGYNSTMGGRGVIPTEETRRKISVSNTGKVCSEETKLKLRAANIGKKRSPESVRRGAENRSGNKHWIFVQGRTRTPEMNEKQRQAMLGRKLTEEHKRKIGLGSTRDDISSEEIVKLYMQGIGITRIGKLLGASQPCITGRLLKSGVKMLPRGFGENQEKRRIALCQ
ncbi:MAG TPA: GIY-YIG nuclease family protein [Nitrosopumilaceae archaeon]|nr:GIY-YIG nuclease family protein [Nitrosopumilaceae archaeon]